MGILEVGMVVGTRTVARRAMRAAVMLGLLGLDGSAAARAEEVALLRPSAGVFEFNLHTASAAELALQYRIGHNTGPLHPVVGAMGTIDGAFCVYAGFGIDIPMGRRFIFRPSLGPGFYHQGQAKDLGAGMVFRTGVEVAWRLASGWRVGLELDHISNSGYAETNRGAESLMVTVAVPMGRR